MRFKDLLWEAAGDAWGLVVSGTVTSMLIGAFIAIVTSLIVRRVKGHAEAKDWIFDSLTGIAATAVVGLGVFVVHLVALTPLRLIGERDLVNTTKGEQIEILTNQVARLKSEVPREVRVVTSNEDAELRKTVGSFSNQLEAANIEIAALKVGRLLSEENQAQITQCLSNAPTKGKVILRPAVFDSSAVECASQFEQILKQAGFEVVFDYMTQTSILSYGFTGERMYLPEPKPEHAIIVQNCFRQQGRAIPLDPREKAAETNVVVIAFGGR